MRITKLHLLLFFLLAGAGIYGAYFWKEKQARDAYMPPPPEPMAEKKFEQEPMVKKSEPASASQPLPPVEAKKEELKSVSYVVERGDTLWKIAKRKEHFGQGHRWYDIWKANEGQIHDFDRLVSGQTLTIPLEKPDGYAWPKTEESVKQRILRRHRHSPSVPAPDIPQS